MTHKAVEENLLYVVKMLAKAMPVADKSATGNQLAVLFFLVNAIQQKYFGHVAFLFPTNFDVKQLEDSPFSKKQITQILSIDWPNMTVDVWGSVYNQIIRQLPQNQYGQHFTDVDEVDIICAFCINTKTKTVLDSAAGAGAFLVRAQNTLPTSSIFGVEIDSSVAQLARFNLCLKKHSQAQILQRDFVDVQVSDLPLMDAIIGNPPYIRHEEIINKKKWLKLSKTNADLSKPNAQCDLYVYYLMHTAHFLKDGGRLGYVISASWLDNAFGAVLQQFLLQHFKIIAIIDQQAKRSFETASVNSVILIIEKCSDVKQREIHAAKFVRLKKNYVFFIGDFGSANRKQKLKTFVQNIETLAAQKKEDMEIFSIAQFNLWQTSLIGNKFENGNWGAKYLRSPNIYQTIISQAAQHFLPLQKIATVRYGVKTGANDFFYLQDYTEKAIDLDAQSYKSKFGKAKNTHKIFWQKHGWYYSSLLNDYVVIERKFIQPILKSQREAKSLRVQKNDLPFVVLTCNATKEALSKTKSPLLQYIQVAEQKYKIHEVASVQGRKNWYDLSVSMHVGDFVFPSKIGDRYRLMDNREANVFCDKVNYVVQIDAAYQKYNDIIFLLLNSICFRFFVELFARQLTGSQTLSDVDVQVVSKTLLPDPKLFVGKQKQIQSLCKSLQSRAQLTIFDEVKMKDRLALEKLIFEAVGLSEKERNVLLAAAVDYVQKRNDKSASLRKVMPKK